MKTFRMVLTLALVLMMASHLMAAGKQKKKEGAKRERGAATEALGGMLQGLNLSAEQKEKVDAIVKEYEPKLAEARKKMDSILTEEQRKARAAAMKEAMAAGKTGGEAFAAAQAAMNLSAEQKAKMAEVRKEMAPIQQELREKVLAVLTPEQQEQVKAKLQQARKGGEAKRGGKKGRKAAN
jgi:Spy/CpxP family protein refolding chaperone